MRSLLLLPALSSLLCTGIVEAQAVDRSKPPALEASAGGITIRRFSGPVTVDGRQWIAAQPNWGGEQLVNASSGQFAVRLVEPNEEGDVVRFRLTFSEPGGIPVSLAPDVVSYAFVARNRWIFFEPIEVVDVRTWRRYSLSTPFDIGPYVGPEAVSADGRRLVFSRRDCPFDCLSAEAEYFEIVLPESAVDARETDPVGELVARLSAGSGMWANGTFPTIDLPATAPIPQVVEVVLAKNRYDKRQVTAHRIMETREVRIGDRPAERAYTAVLVETDLGRKVLLLRPGSLGWWSRVYDE